MAKAAKTIVKLRGVDEPISVAQDLAYRVWAGQSVSLPVIDRVGRIVNALRDKGHDIEGITLPHDDAERLLNAYK